MPSHQNLVDRIVEILRRDLKLGPEFTIAPDTALFGGDLDLDSLDALLLAQSIEKEFKIKIPSESMGPEIFATTQSLGDFVSTQADAQEAL